MAEFPTSSTSTRVGLAIQRLPNTRIEELCQILGIENPQLRTVEELTTLLANAILHKHRIDLPDRIEQQYQSEKDK